MWYATNITDGSDTPVGIKLFGKILAPGESMKLPSSKDREKILRWERMGYIKLEEKKKSRKRKKKEE